MPDPSAGEIGGIFAGVVALLIALGKGLGWLLGWDDRRRETRAAKLDAWHRELEVREKDIEQRQAEYYSKVEGQLHVVMAQNAALVGAYQLIVVALRKNDPASPALGQADELLKAAFPLDPIVPGHLAAVLHNIP